MKTLLANATFLTMDSQLGGLSQGQVLVKNDRVLAVGRLTFFKPGRVPLCRE